MRTVRIEIPNTNKFGTRERYKSVTEDTLVLVSHRNEEELSAFAERTFAPFIANSFLTNNNVASVGEIVDHRLQNETDVSSEEIKFLSGLLDEVGDDLGSIEIIGATAVLSYHGGALIKLRLEAEEHDRRRVIVLGDGEKPLVNFSAEEIIAAIERKF